jgi:hypothetical protein
MEHLKIEISTSQSLNFPALVHLKSKFRSKFGPKSTPNAYNKISSRISLCARKFPVIFSATNAEHWSAYQ